eukprot:gene32803-39658_t
MPSEVIRHAVDCIQAIDVNFVALDFDLTLIARHTGGNYLGPAKDLAIDVRPMFKEFVPAILERNIFLAIVTFSAQVDKIRDVLTIVFGEEVSRSIVIRGREDSWRITGVRDQGGKQSYMASAASELSNHYNVEITKGSTLLIDDDPNNIRRALGAGVMALLFKPDKPESLLEDLDELKNAYLGRKRAGGDRETKRW